MIAVAARASAAETLLVTLEEGAGASQALSLTSLEP